MEEVDLMSEISTFSSNGLVEETLSPFWNQCYDRFVTLSKDAQPGGFEKVWSTLSWTSDPELQKVKTWIEHILKGTGNPLSEGQKECVQILLNREMIPRTDGLISYLSQPSAPTRREADEARPSHTQIQQTQQKPVAIPFVPPPKRNKSSQFCENVGQTDPYWMEMVAKLIDFYEEHQHLNVPKDFVVQGGEHDEEPLYLGSWLETQQECVQMYFDEDWDKYKILETLVLTRGLWSNDPSPTIVKDDKDYFEILGYLQNRRVPKSTGSRNSRPRAKSKNPFVTQGRGRGRKRVKTLASTADDASFVALAKAVTSSSSSSAAAAEVPSSPSPSSSAQAKVPNVLSASRQLYGHKQVAKSNGSGRSRDAYNFASDEEEDNDVEDDNEDDEDYHPESFNGGASGGTPSFYTGSSHVPGHTLMSVESAASPNLGSSLASLAATDGPTSSSSASIDKLRIAATKAVSSISAPSSAPAVATMTSSRDTSMQADSKDAQPTARAASSTVIGNSLAKSATQQRKSLGGRFRDTPNKYAPIINNDAESDEEGSDVGRAAEANEEGRIAVPKVKTENSAEAMESAETVLEHAVPKLPRPSGTSSSGDSSSSAIKTSTPATNHSLRGSRYVVFKYSRRTSSDELWYISLGEVHADRRSAHPEGTVVTRWKPMNKLNFLETTFEPSQILDMHASNILLSDIRLFDRKNVFFQLNPLSDVLI